MLRELTKEEINFIAGGFDDVPDPGNPHDLPPFEGPWQSPHRHRITQVGERMDANGDGVFSDSEIVWRDVDPDDETGWGDFDVTCCSLPLGLSVDVFRIDWSDTLGDFLRALIRPGDPDAGRYGLWDSAGGGPNGAPVGGSGPEPTPVPLPGS